MKAKKYKLKMSTKLSLVYTILATLIMGAAVTFFYYYYMNQVRQENISNLLQVTESVMSKVDNSFETMDQVTIDAMKGADFAKNWTLWNSDERTQQITDYLNDCMISSYKTKSSIRRVSIYNMKGEYLCTGTADVSKTAVRQRAESMLRTYNMKEATSKVFLGDSIDFWYQGSGVHVVTEIKPMKSVNSEVLGFIEVQQNILYMKENCSAQLNGCDVDVAVVFDNEKNAFYQSFSSTHISELKLYTLARQYQAIREEDGLMIGMASSNRIGCKTLILVPSSVLNSSANGMMRLFLFIVIILIILNVLFSQIITKVILKPLMQLVDFMKHTNIDNLGQAKKFTSDTPETDVIMDTFNDMSFRLQKALEDKKTSESIQNKALFDALQTTIGPHFLYNSLGAIANMCEQGENEAAEDACYSLTEILRYFADYKNTEVTLKDEIDNVGAYLRIMKSRYRERLVYHVHMAEECEYQIVPKLCIQPLVENGIKYSLLEQEVVVINVIVEDHANAIKVSIIDNGCGIDEEMLRNIKQDMEQIQKKAVGTYSSANIKFGGMGLAGTLTRLALFFPESFWFQINRNNSGKGTCISFGFTAS